jgi:hypothetical protein
VTEPCLDTTKEVHRAQAARLPLNPADRTPQRRRALASAATLARLHPNDHQARYQTELAAICSGDGAWAVKID